MMETTPIAEATVVGDGFDLRRHDDAGWARQNWARRRRERRARAREKPFGAVAGSSSTVTTVMNWRCSDSFGEHGNDARGQCDVVGYWAMAEEGSELGCTWLEVSGRWRRGTEEAVSFAVVRARN
ncbi:hypothetical protein M0R45_036101 [Rubus argutus]|uniref:MHC class I antigen n=1 Tax=Rubus argutus TaxID=59490 RepID=A0AAW1VWV1_RUBAR